MSSHAGISACRAVSSASGGTMPRACWSANVRSRNASQPSSNSPRYRSAHSSGTWCGAWVAPGAKYMKNGRSGARADFWRTHAIARSVMSSVKWYSSSALRSGSIGVVPSYRAGANWLVSPPRNPKKCSNPPPPVGHASNGPTGLVCHIGTSWHLPNWAVAYPLSRSTSANGAADCGRTEV